jgi:hypothetical protein
MAGFFVNSGEKLTIKHRRFSHKSNKKNADIQCPESVKPSTSSHFPLKKVGCWRNWQIRANSFST